MMNQTLWNEFGDLSDNLEWLAGKGNISNELMDEEAWEVRG